MTIIEFAHYVQAMKKNGAAVVTLSIQEAENLLATLILEAAE